MQCQALLNYDCNLIETLLNSHLIFLFFVSEKTFHREKYTLTLS